MYLNKGRLTAAGLKYMILIVVSSIGLVLFTGAGLIVAIQEQSLMYLAFVFGFTAINVPMLIFGIRGYNLRKRAYSYGRIFENSTNRIFTLTDLEARVGKPREQILKEIRKVSDKGFLTNCSLNMTGEEHAVTLLNRKAAPVEPEPELVEVTCTSCGAKVLIQAGKIAKCEYCGSRVSAAK